MDDSVRDLHFEGEHYATLRSTGEDGGMPDEHLTPVGRRWKMAVLDCFKGNAKEGAKIAEELR